MNKLPIFLIILLLCSIPGFAIAKSSTTIESATLEDGIITVKYNTTDTGDIAALFAMQDEACDTGIFLGWTETSSDTITAACPASLRPGEYDLYVTTGTLNKAPKSCQSGIGTYNLTLKGYTDANILSNLPKGSSGSKIVSVNVASDDSRYYPGDLLTLTGAIKGSSTTPVEIHAFYGLSELLPSNGTIIVPDSKSANFTAEYIIPDGVVTGGFDLTVFLDKNSEIVKVPDKIIIMPLEEEDLGFCDSCHSKERLYELMNNQR